MKKVYITGILGLLGANIANMLKKDFEIVGCDCLEGQLNSVKVDNFDLTDWNSTEKKLIQFNPDVIIHTSAMINVDMCEEEYDLAKQMNEIVTKNLAEFCAMKRIKLIYISTDAVFDGSKDGLYVEEDTTVPINNYGITKLAGEKAVLKYQQNTVLRTNIYGFNYQDKSSFGEWILKSLQENIELSMFEDIYFSPILVTDLAEIIKQVIQRDIHGLFHVCGSGKISKYDFGIYLKEVFQIETGKINKTNSDEFAFKAKRSKNMGMSNVKICNTLNIAIRTPKESIEEFKRQYDSKYREDLRKL